MSNEAPIVIGLVAAALLFGGKKEKKGNFVVSPFAFPDMPPEPEQPAGPVFVLGQLLKPTPETNALYQIREGDNPSNIAKRALPVGASGTRRANYVRAMPRSRWNWMLYASEHSGAHATTFDAGPQSAENPRGFITAAFLPYNDDVSTAIAANDLPYRRYQWGSNPNTQAPIRVNAALTHGATGYGMLWLPPEGGCQSGNDAPCNPMPLLNALGLNITALTPDVET